MLWAKLSTQWWQDPKVLGVGVEAEVLYVRAIAYCKEQLTDGAVDDNALAVLGVKLADPVAAAEQLVHVRLWQKRAQGYAFPRDIFAKWNGTSAEVSQVRSREAERKRAYRARLRMVMSQDCPTGTQTSRDGQPEPEPEPEKALALAKPEPRVRAPARDPEPEPFDGPTDAGRAVIADIRAGLFNHPSNDRRTR